MSKRNAGKDPLDKVEGFFKRSFGKIEKAVRKELEDFKQRQSYLEAFLKDKNVATVSPSSKFISQRVVKALALSGREVVVEYGPADGVLTGPILSSLGPSGILVAVEQNPILYKALVRRIRDPRLKAFQGDVRQIHEILSRLGIAKADRIVSGVPFTFFKPYERGRLLAETYDLLKPGGRFVAYQITTVLTGALELFFPKVKTEFELRNIPPLFVFTCYK